MVNEDFEHDTEEYYHHYKIVHSQQPQKVLEGLEFVFVELPKFKAKSITEKKLSILWLRFLAEIENNTTEVSSDLREVPEIEEALQLLAESGYSVSELAAYDKYWDSIVSEKTIVLEAFEQGVEEGKEIGREEERVKAYQEKLVTAKTLKAMGLNPKQIAQATGVSENEIEKLG